jgi:hypothetical protein
MARKSVADQAKAKAEKQKKMVIVLGVVLAGALAYGVHTMMALNKGGGSKPEAAPAVTTTATPTPAPASTPLPAAPTLSGVAPTSATPSGSISQQLVSAVQAPANVGQLQSFSLFESKDPFHAGGPSSSTSSTSGGSGTGSKGSGSSSKPPKAPPAPPTPPPTSAVVSVNGSSETVMTGANFPAANPMFQLVSLTDTTAKVSVAGGSYASGAPTLTLKVNVPVTLVNTADGTRYTLQLYPQGTVAPTGSSSSSSSGTPPTTTDTTPATTTTTSG